MRWLNWSTLDLKNGIGGVETHARRVTQELVRLGMEAVISSDRDALNSGEWDVIQTHGSLPVFGVRQGASRRMRAVRVHTLHGSSLERLSACGEWKWAGGYAAFARECAGVARADLIASVHEGISIYQWSQKIGKPGVVCGNGWDSFPMEKSVGLPRELEQRLSALGEYWVFIGRGEDRVKGADLVRDVLRLKSNLKLVAVPGEGFEGMDSALRTGPLPHAQVRAVLEQAQGLILPSRYEGLPLVVLEALALGVCVVATSVGGVARLSGEMQGLIRTEKVSASGLLDALFLAMQISSDPVARTRRGDLNREFLMTWKDVAQRLLRAVRLVRESR